MKEIGFISGKAVAVTPVYYLIDGKAIMSEITVKDTDAPLNATVTFLDAKGNPTEPDDTPQWSSDNEAVCTVAASADGKSAVVTIAGKLGAAVVGVKSTDTNGTEILSQGTVTVQASEATVGDVEFTKSA